MHEWHPEKMSAVFDQTMAAASSRRIYNSSTAEYRSYVNAKQIKFTRFTHEGCHEIVAEIIYVVENNFSQSTTPGLSKLSLRVSKIFYTCEPHEPWSRL
jgi:CRISPR/Cas system type I-B associated protein Csh2 (Cas7 group RAMP superfamily)